LIVAVVHPGVEAMADVEGLQPRAAVEDGGQPAVAEAVAEELQRPEQAHLSAISTWLLDP
jgi:hypothetical protein